MVVLKFIWEEPMTRDQMCGEVGKLLRKGFFQMSYPEKKIIVGKNWMKKIFFHTFCCEWVDQKLKNWLRKK